MNRSVCLIAVLLLSVVAVADDPPKRPKKPELKPEAPGIHWEADFEQGLARAAREGRPILFCINALENERANVELATQIYRSAAWGRATRGYVAFVCNPNEHDGPDGISTRYPGTRSATAQAALAYVMKRFGNDLISPQHIILEPDGDLAYRKEYYEHIVGPELLDAWLARISPPAAYARANIDRESEIDALSKATSGELGAQVRRWVTSNDGLAVVGVLCVLDDEYDGGRRRTLVQGLAAARSTQAPAVAYGADERVSYPDEEPGETRAWLETLFAVDRPTAVVAAAKAVSRSPDKSERDALLAVWAGSAEGTTPSLGDLPLKERGVALEALLLAGDTRARNAKDPAGIDADMKRRLARARVASGITTRISANLDAAFRDGRPGVLHRALLDADADEVRSHEALILEAFGSPREQVRLAAALALLWSESSEVAAEIADVITRAVFDPVEGPEAREQAVGRLGDDPGLSPEEWHAAICARLDEGAGR